MYNKFKNKDFVVLAVNIKEDRKTIKKYVDETGMPFPVLIDSKGQLAHDYGIRGTPAHLLIDRNGDIKGFSPGFNNWNSKESQKLIQFMID